jgi:hypothetical protein
MTSPVVTERGRLQAGLTRDLCRSEGGDVPVVDRRRAGLAVVGLSGGTTMLHTGKDAGAFTFAAIDHASGDNIVIPTNSDNGWRVILPVLERTGSNPN